MTRYYVDRDGRFWRTMTNNPAIVIRIGRSGAVLSGANHTLAFATERYGLVELEG